MMKKLFKQIYIDWISKNIEQEEMKYWVEQKINVMRVFQFIREQIFTYQFIIQGYSVIDNIQEIILSCPAMRTDLKSLPRQQNIRTGFRTTKSYTGMAKQEGVSKSIVAHIGKNKQKEEQKYKIKRARFETDPHYEQKRVINIKSEKTTPAQPTQQFHFHQNRFKTQDVTLNGTKKTPKSANTKTTETRSGSKVHQAFLGVNQKKLSWKLTKIGDQLSIIKKGERRKQREKIKNKMHMKNMNEPQTVKQQRYISMKSMVIFSENQLVSSFIDETQTPSYSSRYEIYQDRIKDIKKEDLVGRFFNSIDMRVIKEIKRVEGSQHQRSTQITIIKDLIKKGKSRAELQNAAKVIQRFWRKLCKKGVFKQYYSIFSSVCQSFQRNKQREKQVKIYETEDWDFDQKPNYDDNLIRLIEIPFIEDSDQEVSQSIKSQEIRSNQGGPETKVHSFYERCKAKGGQVQKYQTGFEQFIGDQSISKLFCKNTMEVLKNTNNMVNCTQNTCAEHQNENDQFDQFTKFVLGILIKQASLEVKNMIKIQTDDDQKRFEDQPRKMGRIFNPDSLFLCTQQQQHNQQPLNTLNTGVSINSFHLFTHLLLQVLEKSPSLHVLLLKRISSPIGLNSLSFLKQFHRNNQSSDTQSNLSQSSDFLDKIILPYSLYEQIIQKIFERNIYHLDFQQFQQIWFGCIFDSFNELLDQYRPFGTSIRCYPWTSKIKVPKLVQKNELVGILRQSVNSLHKNVALPVGTISGKRLPKCLAPLNQQTQQLLKQMRMLEYIASQLQSNERFWEQIDDLKMTVITEIWQYLEGLIYEELIKQLNAFVKKDKRLKYG